jgi:hypothetical protein
MFCAKEGKIVQTRSDNQLENLDPKMQEGILELAANGSLPAVLKSLEEHGIAVSLSTLKRFVRRHREKCLLKDAEESSEALEALAASGRSGKLREGSLEAVRRQLYDRALGARDPEEARELFAAMVGEETKLKQIELEARRVAAFEEQVKIQRLKVELDGVGKRQKAMVASSEVVEAGRVAEGGDAGEKPKQLTEGNEDGKRLVRLFGEVMGILNRGGLPEERLLEARALLCEEMKAMG